MKAIANDDGLDSARVDSFSRAIPQSPEHIGPIAAYFVLYRSFPVGDLTSVPSAVLDFIKSLSLGALT